MRGLPVNYGEQELRLREPLFGELDLWENILRHDQPARYPIPSSSDVVRVTDCLAFNPFAVLYDRHAHCSPPCVDSIRKILLPTSCHHPAKLARIAATWHN
jgi:hypothetical protein